MPRPLRLLLGFGLVALIIGATASPAAAQYYGPPRRGYGPPRGYPAPPPPDYGRQGLVIGFGIGGGTITGNNCPPGFCGGAISGEFHIGGMINDRLALEGEAWGSSRTNFAADTSLSQTFWTFAAQYWLTEQLWLKGGLGIAHLQVGDTYAVYNDETALGLVLAGGGEIYSTTYFAVDLQLRFGRGFYPESTGGGVSNYALLIGFNWY